MSGTALAQALRDSRARLLASVADLSDAQWQVPERPGVNPIAWELAHVAWFAEFWTLRGPHRLDDQGLIEAATPPRHAGPDALLDSARLAHARRWQVALPSRDAVLRMLEAQLDACIAALPDGDDDRALYFHRLALFHEDMHAEALTWLRSALGHAAPADASLPKFAAAEPLPVRGGHVRIGWQGARGFHFDNEAAAHEQWLDDFVIDAHPVRCADFLRFVEAGGYERAECWSEPGQAWLRGAGRRHPARWRRDAAGWQQRWFDRWAPLDPDAPVMHVNAWEAEAYAHWAGARLPRAAEWEHAASTTGMAWGASVWEWTADAFEPYPGFEPGPYRAYSQPWFGDHRELRGGAFASAARLHHPSFRNFFRPERSDVFAGFRTVRSP